jgi:CheY-like chemotaxis protein/HPt (histidine-containing phosphotransfer) domain-containing protein
VTDLHRALLAEHRSDLAGRIESLGRRIEEGGATPDCASVAHGLKGAALTLGLDALAVAAAAVEAACDADGGDPSSALRALALARREIAADGAIPARIGHDLRGGLNIVIGHASLLELEPLSPLQADSVREILAAADGMAATLSGLGRPSAGSPTPPPAPVTGGRRVLVVDDDAATGHMLVRMLAEAGATAVLQPTAAGALREARARPPDLVILDLGLPDADGRDVLRTLRAAPGLAGVPVVISSGDSGTLSGRELAQAGATAILPKPISLATIRRLVEELPPAER